MAKRHNQSRRSRAISQAAPSAAMPTAFATWNRWFFAIALLAAVVLAYQPAWQGGFIWDDNGHVTRADLRSWHGLYRIWFERGATQQYYPLLHSAFWLEHKLWGDATLGYHLVNILLHVAAALMVAVILRRLAIPGAYLAAAIFALHPVQVESVAWITELKNTLSAVFYLAAAIAYLRFDQQRTRNLYLLALGLFLLGLLSKTVTASLPGALLVIFWWQRGHLAWRRDILPLVPFFALGAIAGIFTAWVERTLIGADGAPFAMTGVDRCLLAGRVVWFYLAKLLWPTNLSFIYPRWNICQAVAWQYLFPLATLTLVAVLWKLRRRWRGPLAGFLFFVGTLFPVLGFFNVYPFIYSFVADHFQYLASLGIITLASAGAVLLLERWHLWRRPIGYGLCLILLGTLWVLTWRQSQMYADIETLYVTTIVRNPKCWMAHNNLGAGLANRGQQTEAIAHYRKALDIKPDYAEAHNNLGAALAGCGKADEAMAHFRKALEIKPNYAEAHINFSTTLAERGKKAEAIDHLRQAAKIKPNWAEAHTILAMALAKDGQADEAIDHFREALEIKPDHDEAHNGLGVLLVGRGQAAEAIDHFRKAIEVKPDYAEAHNNLGIALADRGQAAEAIVHFRKALNLASALGNAEFVEAIRARLKPYQAGPPHGQTPPTSPRSSRP